MIVRIAERHAVHPSAVCIKWAVQRGQTPIPFSVNPRHYAANLRAAAEDPLNDEEMREIAAIDRNCRLIKGQVFLVEGRAELGGSLGRGRGDHAAVGGYVLRTLSARRTVGQFA